MQSCVLQVRGRAKIGTARKSPDSTVGAFWVEDPEDIPRGYRDPRCIGTIEVDELRRFGKLCQPEYTVLCLLPGFDEGLHHKWGLVLERVTNSISQYRRIGIYGTVLDGSIIITRCRIFILSE